MTLILAAVKHSFAVIASDGIEFTHSTDGSKIIARENYQKIFPLPARRVLAVHGQNRLHSDEHPGGKEISTIIAENSKQFSRLRTVRAIAEFLRDLLDPLYKVSAEHLTRSGLPSGALKIIVIGFDAGGLTCQAFENLWLPKTSTEIVEFDCKNIRVFHGGSGEPFAIRAIGDERSTLHPNTVKDSPLDDVRSYVQRLYRAADAIQPAEAPEFGGMYQCITVNRNGVQWHEGEPQL